MKTRSALCTRRWAKDFDWTRRQGCRAAPFIWSIGTVDLLKHLAATTDELAEISPYALRRWHAWRQSIHNVSELDSYLHSMMFDLSFRAELCQADFCFSKLRDWITCCQINMLSVHKMLPIPMCVYEFKLGSVWAKWHMVFLAATAFLVTVTRFVQFGRSPWHAKNTGAADRRPESIWQSRKLWRSFKTQIFFIVDGTLSKSSRFALWNLSGLFFLHVPLAFSLVTQGNSEKWQKAKLYSCKSSKSYHTTKIFFCSQAVGSCNLVLLVHHSKMGKWKSIQSYHTTKRVVLCSLRFFFLDVPLAFSLVTKTKQLAKWKSVQTVEHLLMEEPHKQKNTPHIPAIESPPPGFCGKWLTTKQQETTTTKTATPTGSFRESKLVAPIQRKNNYGSRHSSASASSSHPLENDFVVAMSEVHDQTTVIEETKTPQLITTH